MLSVCQTGADNEEEEEFMTVYQVSDQKSLQQAIASAKGGDVIDVQKDIDLSGLLTIRYKNFTADDPLTIKSSTGATIEGQLVTRDSSHIVFEDLSLSIADSPLLTPTDATDKIMRVINSTDITFDGVTFEGRMVSQGEIKAMTANGVTNFAWARADHASGVGMTIDGSKNVTIQNSEFHSLLSGVGMQRAANGAVENTTIKDSYFHDLRSDGIQGGDHLNTTITGNVFENFDPYTTDHADFIQYWAAYGKYGIENMQISDNVFIQTDAASVQTIFGGYSLRAGDSFDGNEFEDFSVTGNTIFSSHSHGITLQGVDGFEIVGNILVPNQMGLNPDTGSFVKTVYVPRVNITHPGADADKAKFLDILNDYVTNAAGVKSETRFARDGIIQDNILTGGVYGGDIRFTTDKISTTDDDHVTFSPDGLNINVADNASILFSGTSAAALAARAAYGVLSHELEAISSKTGLSISQRYDLYRDAFADYAAATGNDWDGKTATPGGNGGSGSGGTGGGNTGGGGTVTPPPLDQDDDIDDVDDFDWIDVSGMTTLGNDDASVKVVGSHWTSTTFGSGSYKLAIEDADGYRHFGIQHFVWGFDDDDVLDLSLIFDGLDIDASNVADYVKAEYMRTKTSEFTYLSFDVDGDGTFDSRAIKIEGDFSDLAALIDNGHLYLG